MATSVFLAFVLPCSRQSREAGLLVTWPTVRTAEAVLFLASEDSPLTGGANLFVDGGVSAMDLS